MRLLKFSLMLVAGLLLGGCATSTVESRKQERPAAYSAFAVDTRSLVDQGKIKVGMSMDAVYIAWGKPSQTLTGESPAGTTTTWLYHGTFLQPYRYWNYRTTHHGGWCYPEPYLDFDYYPRNYVRAEVIFDGGLVKEWRSLPLPQPY